MNIFIFLYITVSIINQKLIMIPQPTHQIKLVFVGDSSVGKSSILTRFVDDQFHDTLLSTIGVDFKFRRIKVNGEQIKLQIWDTAGQQAFRSLVSAYYHSADGIVIVYDITAYKSFQSILEYWIKQAENNNKNDACVFLIGNKVDDAETKRDVQAFSVESIVEKHKIQKIFQVSAKTGEKIQETFIQICKILISKNKGVKKDMQNKADNQKRLTRSAPNIKVSEPIKVTPPQKKKKCCH